MWIEQKRVRIQSVHQNFDSKNSELQSQRSKIITFFLHFTHLLKVASSAAEIIARVRTGGGRIALLAGYLLASEHTVVQRFVQIDQLLLAQALAHFSLSLQAFAAGRAGQNLVARQHAHLQFAILLDHPHLHRFRIPAHQFFAGDSEWLHFLPADLHRAAGRHPVTLADRLDVRFQYLVGCR